MNCIFYLQNIDQVNNYDLDNLRIFYTPIVGHKSLLLYEHFVDLYSINLNINKKLNLQNTYKLLQINHDEFTKSREILEGLGLIKTFITNEGNYVIELKKPLNANQIANNDLISTMLIKKIGRELYEYLIKEKGAYNFKKKDLCNISKKCYEVFDLSDTAETEILPIDFEINNNYESAKLLNSFTYINKITNLEANKAQINMINNLKKLNFNDHAINLFINYSVEVNNSIVINYIEKIAKDYAKKDIFDANQIDAELAFAKSSKMINKDDEKYNNYYKNLINTNTDTLNIDILKLSNESNWD